MSYILIDIGGTNTQVSLSDDLSKLDSTVKIPTHGEFKAGIKALKEAVASLKPKSNIKALAVGIKGLLNEEKTGIENDSILSGWAKQPLAETLEKHFKAPVLLENDTALAGLGEAVMGAGKDLDIIAYHSISAGIGGVRIENGKIDNANSGFDPGQQILDIDRTILGEDITPTLNNLVSGLGLEARLGTKPYDIPQEDVVWHELAEYLAHGLRNTILYWSPDVIILGGSMILGDPKISIDDIRKFTTEVLDGFVTAPFITVGSLGEYAGLYGGMVLLKQSDL